ncbi:Transposase IS66 [Furfurilactobacillus rossiae]|uniref:transposase domain-containing protein n=1 Tax=Furfurilactobacillus rossiae TaxID=231049 RepID=UPI0015B7C1D0|nr:transposase domain-containing protein [Furfurilactobacillus rossiae]MCF6165373.1 transposase domain-containing protein [Furfurilactobacillus rossiae]QLE63733.1 Transposase IS66 [Furfurilactobacillus rossiae]
MLRKNSLFSKSQAGAKANAMYLSFIESAKANQLDPKAYLNYLFTELPERGQNPDLVDLEAYLPWNVKPEALKQEPK